MTTTLLLIVLGVLLVALLLGAGAWRARRKRDFEEETEILVVGAASLKPGDKLRCPPYRDPPLEVVSVGITGPSMGGRDRDATFVTVKQGGKK